MKNYLQHSNIYSKNYNSFGNKSVNKKPTYSTPITTIKTIIFFRYNSIPMVLFEIIIFSVRITIILNLNLP